MVSFTAPDESSRASGGWRDGGPGLVLCRASAFYVLAKYVKLWRLGQT